MAENELKGAYAARGRAAEALESALGEYAAALRAIAEADGRRISKADAETLERAAFVVQKHAKWSREDRAAEAAERVERSKT